MKRIVKILLTLLLLSGIGIALTYGQMVNQNTQFTKIAMFTGKPIVKDTCFLIVNGTDTVRITTYGDTTRISTTAGGGFKFSPALSAGGGSVVVSDSAWSKTGNSGTNPATDFIGTTDAVDFIFKTNANEAMRIDSNGNVGIGTATPAYKLDIVGGANHTGGVFQSDATHVSISSCSGDEQIEIGLCEEEVTVGGISLGLRGDDSVQIQSAAKVIIQPTDDVINSYVGIGTYTPTAKLHINSTIGNALRLTDGTQGLGKLLTSDADGNATWQSVSAALAILPEYADDAAAATGGVPVGGAYYNTTLHAYTKRES